jgi:hypothetical protein
MRKQEFLAAFTGHSSDLKLVLEAKRATVQRFCLVGELAVNHYVEPVVTLDAAYRPDSAWSDFQNERVAPKTI